MSPPPTADKVILQNCLKVALMREECPAGMPEAQKKALVNKVLALKNSDLSSPGTLSKFIKVVRSITGHSEISLNNLFVSCLSRLEVGRHYTISKGGYLKTDGGGGFRARGVTLTALGKNQLLTAGAQHAAPAYAQLLPAAAAAEKLVKCLNCGKVYNGDCPCCPGFKHVPYVHE